MGQEAQCTASFNGERSGGRAYLETEALTFRGTFRVTIPYARILSLQAKEGRLKVRFPGGVVTFELPAHAEAWAEKIRHPRSLLDKLGVKPTDRVAVLGIDDRQFLQRLRSRAGGVVADKVPKDMDAIILQADRRTALGRLPRLVSALTPSGSLWVVAPKGITAITEADVLAAGRKAGMVDVKVVRFSKTHTAHKFVIPVAKRQSVSGRASRQRSPAMMPGRTPRVIRSA